MACHNLRQLHWHFRGGRNERLRYSLGIGQLDRVERSCLHCRRIRRQIYFHRRRLLHFGRRDKRSRDLRQTDCEDIGQFNRLGLGQLGRGRPDHLSSARSVFARSHNLLGGLQACAKRLVLGLFVRRSDSGQFPIELVPNQFLFFAFDGQLVGVDFDCCGSEISGAFISAKNAVLCRTNETARGPGRFRPG